MTLQNPWCRGERPFAPTPTWVSQAPQYHHNSKSAKKFQTPKQTTKKKFREDSLAFNLKTENDLPGFFPAV